MGIFGSQHTILGQISQPLLRSHKQQVKQGFQLLGQDLHRENLSQRKAIFASLQQLPGGTTKALSSHLFRCAGSIRLLRVSHWRRI